MPLFRPINTPLTQEFADKMTSKLESRYPNIFPHNELQYWMRGCIPKMGSGVMYHIEGFEEMIDAFTSRVEENVNESKSLVRGDERWLLLAMAMELSILFRNEVTLTKIFCSTDRFAINEARKKLLEDVKQSLDSPAAGQPTHNLDNKADGDSIPPPQSVPPKSSPSELANIQMLGNCILKHPTVKIFWNSMERARMVESMVASKVDGKAIISEIENYMFPIQWGMDFDNDFVDSNFVTLWAEGSINCAVLHSWLFCCCASRLNVRQLAAALVSAFIAVPLPDAKGLTMLKYLETLDEKSRMEFAPIMAEFHHIFCIRLHDILVIDEQNDESETNH